MTAGPGVTRGEPRSLRGEDLATATVLMDAVSLEVSAKGIPALQASAEHLLPGTTIALPYLPSENDEDRLKAARAVRQLGFNPLLHLAARRLSSTQALERLLNRATTEAGIEACLVIAGDPSTPHGPFADSAAVINSGLLEAAGIRTVCVGAHPQGHPLMDAAQGWTVLERKCAAILQRGMSPTIVTQFVFDATTVLQWLQALRARGLQHPVRIGVPGPAGITSLLRYASMCGVSASASMLSRYGISLGRLLGSAGPDQFVEQLRHGLDHTHGDVALHFYPFGGVAQTVAWIEQHRPRTLA